MDREQQRRWILPGFLLVVVLILGGFLVHFYSRAKEAERTLEYQYLKSMDDLGNYLENIETTLTKAMYAGNPETVDDLTAKLWRESGFAKESLSTLPAGDLNLTNTYQFLSQVGEYALSLSKQEEITKDQRETLGKLRVYADDFLQEMLAAQDAIRTGSTSFDAVKAAAQVEDTDEVNAVTEGFLEFEEGFTAYPTLVYDGPFSDHLLQQTPKMTANAPKISMEDAKKTAAKACGVSADELTNENDEQGTMPSYCFTGTDCNAAVTMQGGYLSYFIKYRSVGEEKKSVQACEEAALNYLNKIGIKSVRTTYYEKSGGLVTFNFAYNQSGVVCYSDLIKVSVALDNAEVLRYDARGYLVNHEERNNLKAAVSEKQARKAVSELLTVQKTQLALVPDDGGKEKLCYEFTCTSEQDENVLVYVSAETGKEHQLLVLYIDENGTLTL